MTKQNFSNLSTKELIKKKKNMSFLLGLLIGALTLIVLLIISRHEWQTPLLAIPVAALPLLIICYGQFNSMRKELKSREAKRYT